MFQAFWTGTPSCVSRRVAAGLETGDGIPIQNAWNIQHLRKFNP